MALNMYTYNDNDNNNENNNNTNNTNTNHDTLLIMIIMDRRFEPGEPVLVYLGCLDGWKQARRNF